MSKEFKDLYVRRQYRNKPAIKPEKEVIGFDTETYKGRAFLICSSDGKSHPIKGFNDILFAVHRVEYTKTLNLFYNLKFDALAMLKYLPRDVLKELYIVGKVDYEGVRINYIPKKRLSIRRQNRTVTFFDIAQYYMMSLDKASKKYLGEGKNDMDVQKFDSLAWIGRNIDEIIEYCLKDSVLCARLGVYWQRLATRAGLDFNKPMSPAYLSSRYYQAKCDIPVLYSPEVMEYSYKSYNGGRFEVFQRGYFDTLYKYDIRSAYPDVIRQLLDISRGSWYHSTVFMEGAEYGFLRCKISTVENLIQPLMLKVKGLCIFPQFKKIIKYITLDEYRFIKDHHLGTAEFLDGVFFFPTDERIVFDCVEQDYKHRAALKKRGDDLEKVFKIVLNSLYGKMIERTKKLVKCDRTVPGGSYVDVVGRNNIDTYKVRYETGNLFNPVYASLITSRTRLRLLEPLLDRQESIVSFFTDSIMSTERLPISGSGLGSWDYEGKYEGVLIGTGVYSLLNDQEYVCKLRGFRLANNVDMFDLLEKNKHRRVIKTKQKHVLSLGECLIHTRTLSVEDINRFIEQPKNIDINFDHKRLWGGDLPNCRALLRKSYASTSHVC